jgi:hypothetical protein
MGIGQGLCGGLGITGGGRSAQGAGDERLRGGAAGLKDCVPALGLSDALQS